MKRKRFLANTLILALIFALLAGLGAGAADTGTGYTDASQVNYQTYTENGRTVLANWGARDEVSTFLSLKAEAFYTDGYTYDEMSLLEGGTTQQNASASPLYAELKELMTDKHTYITNYQETRYQYRYTDCEKGDIAHISSFYSGKQLSGTWDSGSTWNREHTWPRSKCINTSKAQDSADLMMLRPTWVQENSSRGNDAYGISDGYFEPADNVKGDCARIALYGYTRWGNTSKMWGSGGMIENLEILLQWMEEDPVDTWEMGRNDAVESITGTRNVFVDYPEYAWLIFGAEIPEDLITPSGEAMDSREPNLEHTTAESTTQSEPEQSASQEEKSTDKQEPIPDSGCKAAFGGSAVILLALPTGLLLYRKRID